MIKKTENKNQRQRQALVRILMMVAILICVNVLASYFHSGIDLTKEKRFTLSEPTIRLLKNMHEVAVIDVYLKGKFPAGIQRLEEAVRERLRSFKDVAGNKIIFRFTDPFEGKSDDEKKQVAHDLEQKGIVPHELKSSNDDNDEYSMKVFFPYALVQYNGKQMPVLLLDYMSAKNSPAEMISYAETMLEYKFANALNQMGRRDIAHIAYITGNGEPLGMNTYDMLSTLQHHYWLDTVDLAHVSQISLAYDAILIVQPKMTFTEPEKLRIDQYIIHGGHALFSLNMLDANLDSLRIHPPQLIAMDNNLELDNLLFQYGVRVNKDLVEDKENMQLARTMNDGQPQLHDWIYFPKLNPTSDHPIVRNMDFIRAGFTNSIDTIRSRLIKKTILLQTSKYSMKADAPARVSLSMMNFPIPDEIFTKSYIPVAILLEGKFRSAYAGKLAPVFLQYLSDTLKQPFKVTADTDGSIIVTSVGDMFMNTYNQKDGVLPMGYYFWTNDFFANRDFLLNSMEYLTDRSGILEARSKEMKLRLLDTGRAKEEKSTWQFVNVGIPIAIVLVFASCYFFFRKRRYEIKQDEIKPSPKDA